MAKPSRPKAPPTRALLAVAFALLAAAVAAGGFVASRGSHDTTTITEKALGGLELASADTDYDPAWGPSAITPLRYPENYAKRTFGDRKVGVYFASGDIQGAIRNGDARIVEITTWNESNRIEKDIGPCSTVEELKAAYGSALAPVEANIIEGKVYGYTVGNHLFFAVGSARDAHPCLVGRGVRQSPAIRRLQRSRRGDVRVTRKVASRSFRLTETISLRSTS